MTRRPTVRPGARRLATGLLALFLVAASDPTAAGAAETPRGRPEANLTFRSPTAGFRLIAPDASWTLERRRVGPRHVRLMHGKGTAPGQAAAQLEVRLVPPRRPANRWAKPQPESRTPESYLVEQAARRKLQVERQGPVELGGQPAWEMISSYRGLTLKQVVALHDGQLYLIEAQASRLAFPSYLSIFDDIIRTFAFIAPG
jgi:hypothetical protein